MNNEKAFSLACEYGHSDIAEYLIKLGEKSYGLIDIHIGSDKIYHLALFNSHFDVAGLLQMIGEESYGTIDLRPIKAKVLCRLKTNFDKWIKIYQWLLNPNEVD